MNFSVSLSLSFPALFWKIGFLFRFSVRHTICRSQREGMYKYIFSSLSLQSNMLSIWLRLNKVTKYLSPFFIGQPQKWKIINLNMLLPPNIWHKLANNTITNWQFQRFNRLLQAPVQTTHFTFLETDHKMFDDYYRFSLSFAHLQLVKSFKLAIWCYGPLLEASFCAIESMEQCPFMW